MQIVKYGTMIEGKFIRRINRFTAVIEMEGKETLCHVKNTGRCKELFVEGVKVYLEKSDNPDRKTAYSLIAVEKEGILVNVDSQVPNKVVKEWLEQEEKQLVSLKPEKVFGNSRFDFYMERGSEKIWIEVKGVTLVKDGIAMFPDAPTERGIKHIEELCRAVEEGYEAWLIFIIQRKKVAAFRPNEENHLEFAQALRKAEKRGVRLLAFDSIVTKNAIKIDQPVRIEL